MAKLPALVVLLALVVAAPASGTTTDLYALRYGARMNVLVPYDPVRLVPVGSSIRLGPFAHAWSMSPDRTRFVATPSGGRGTNGPFTELRFVDLARGRIEGTMSLPGERRRVTATAWVGGRVLAVVSGVGSTIVYAADPDKRVVSSHVEIPGTVVLGERTPTGIVLLLATPGVIGPATVAVVDRSLRVRSVVLESVTVGTTATGTGVDRRTVVRRPGLAIAPSGRRAFVFGSEERAVVIDLRTLAARYRLVRTVAAVAKRAEGSVRTAATLPDGRIVVSGYELGSATSATLRLVNSKNWTSRALAAPTSWFRVGGGVVFTHGARGTGLRIVKPSGGATEMFSGRAVGNVFVIGPRAFVTFFGTGQRAAIIELDSGRVIRQSVPAHPLIGAGQPIFVG